MKISSQIFLISIVSLGLGASALAQVPFKSTDVEGYTFRHITDRIGTDRLPRVSTNGHVTWEGFTGGGHVQIFLSNVSEGATTEQVTSDAMVNLRPVVNKHGDLAWTKVPSLDDRFDQEVFVRHNGIVTQVTNDPADNRREERYPDINDNGYVVWAYRTPTFFTFRLSTYDINSGDLANYDSVAAYRPHISNDNLIEFGGSTIVDLLGNEVVDIPRAVDAGYRFFRRGEIGHSNQLAIEADPGTAENTLHPDFEGPRDILLWDGSELQTVYSSPVWVGRADLNSSGILAFEGVGGLPGSKSSPDDFEIFVYNVNTEELIQLTDDDFNDRWPTVLEDGSIVWHGQGDYPTATNTSSLDIDIFIATPIISEVVAPDAFTVFRGLQISGQLSDALESDDSRLSFNPGFTINSSEAPVWLIFDATLSSDSPNGLELAAESQAGTPGLVATLEAFNWVTGAYDVVDVSAASINTDTIVSVDLSSQIPDYVQTGTGAIRSRIGWRQTGFVINYPWEVRLDQMVWTVLR